MEEGYSEQRLAGFRKFLNGFVGEKDSTLIQDDPIQFRGSIVGSFRLHVSDIPAEVLDWALLYLHQRKCPQDLAWVLAREVQSRVESLLPSIVPPVTNGGTTDADSPDEGQYLLESSLLYNEMLSQLQQVCCQLNNSDTDLVQRSSTCKLPQYQTSLVAVKNVRRKMEDRHVVIPDLNALCGLVDGPAQSYYAVFDGHSGAEAANFCSAHLHWNLVQHAKFECDPETAMREAFQITEDQFEHRSQREGIKSGCTAVCCLIRDKMFYLAWLGDSQAILVKKGVPITVMAPHKPERSDEKERVEKMGGCVMHVGTWRVNGILAVSRALGDFEHKPCVSSDPDIIQMPLDGEEDFLVLACDGLWDTLTPNDVTAAVYHYINQDCEDIDDIAAQVSQQAIDRGSTDNVTVIIVFLRDLQALAAQSAVTSFSTESIVNHGSNPFGDVENVFNAKGHYYENGDGEHDVEMTFGELSHPNGRGDIFAQHMPEQTSISELPTPPIEDLMNVEDMYVHLDQSLQIDQSQGSTNPFESQDSSTEAHDNRAKEIASAILNSALESAAQGEAETLQSEVVCEVDAVQAFKMDSAFFSGQQEVNPPLGVLAENDNFVESPKPWVLQVQHSNQSDEVDYLPSGEHPSNISNIDVLNQFPDYYQEEENPKLKFNVTMENAQLVTEFSQEASAESKLPSIIQHVPEAFDHGLANIQETVPVVQEPVEEPRPLETQLLDTSLPESEGMQELSPEMIEEAQMELEDVQSKLQELTGMQLLSDVQLSSQLGVPEYEQVTSTQPDHDFHNEAHLFDTSVTQTSQQFNVSFGTDDSFVVEEKHTEIITQESHISSTVYTEFSEQAPVDVSTGEQFSPGQQENFNPFAQSQDMFGFAEEIPCALRSVQGVPEMIGISEAVPGIQTSEPLVAPESLMTSQKEVLAAFEDILVPSSPDQPPAATVTDLLKTSAVEFEGAVSQQIVEIPESPITAEDPFKPEPTSPAETQNILVAPEEIVKVDTIAELQAMQTATEIPSPDSTVPVQNSLLVDFIAPQMTVPELADPEAVANLLSSDVPPTPEVVLEKIPDGVPEADGVTEDSDSEKDGGWSYVSTKGKEPSADDSATKKTKVVQSTATMIKKSTTSSSKEQVKTSTLSKSATAKSAEKPKPKPPTPKVSAQPSTTTLKKTPSDPIKKVTSTMIRAKPAPSSAAAKGAITSPKTTVTAATTAVTKEIEVKAGVTKSSTTSRTTSARAATTTVTSTLSKRTTPTAKPATSTAAKPSPTSTVSKTATMRAAKPAPTAAPKTTSTVTSARPASTLNRMTAKPATTAAATRPATATSTLARKPTTTTATSKTTMAKVPPARPATTTLARTQKPPTEAKQTKDTVNKQLVTQPGTLKNKTVASRLSNKTGSATSTTTTTVTKSSTRTSSTSGKTLKSATTSTKTVTKTAIKDENETTKPEKNEPTRQEPEKGSLEDRGKDNHAVDSGLASPESPVSPQLSLVNGNHQVDAPIEEKAVLEQAELN